MSIMIVHKNEKDKIITLATDGFRQSSLNSKHVLTNNALKNRRYTLKNNEGEDLTFYISIFNDSSLYEILELVFEDSQFPEKWANRSNIRKYLLKEFIPSLIRVMDKYKYNKVDGENKSKTFAADILLIIEGNVFVIYSDYTLEDCFFENGNNPFYCIGNNSLGANCLIDYLSTNTNLEVDNILIDTINTCSKYHLYINDNPNLFHFSY